MQEQGNNKDPTYLFVVILTPHKNCTPMAAEISHLLAATQQQPAKRRKDCQYNDKEKEVLCKYKDEYKGLRTHAEREALLRGKVFVDIFNYWLQEEGKMPTEEMVTKRIEVYFVQKVAKGLMRHTPGTLRVDPQ